jgi:mercuric ion transport protein
MVSILTPVSRDNSPIGIPSDLSAREAVTGGTLGVPCFCSRYRMLARRMTTKEDLENRLRCGQKLMAAGGILGTLAASSCCILPLSLLSLGIPGAWIGNFTQLAPYQPYFIATTLLFLGYGYRLVYRPGTRTCAEGETCARRSSNRISLILATILVAAALGLDFIAPLSRLVTGEPT